ncbi:hypothetical protein [Ktedonobacter racemifer]|uniref:Uncharacterized protein n=1 Tax=Ktedonobacter racemifer DSM 44963 TaxID=485913 RepID=D6U7V1_KTERA|nr:hypothetical protein [Ktedonobacter racemifer]EFH79962.1 hypothetical protein Krac_0494 [Ktedonobacter racemifer DSM 44963]
MNTQQQRSPHLSLMPSVPEAAPESRENTDWRDAGLEEDAGLVPLYTRLQEPQQCHARPSYRCHHTIEHTTIWLTRQGLDVESHRHI